MTDSLPYTTEELEDGATRVRFNVPDDVEVTPEMEARVREVVQAQIAAGVDIRRAVARFADGSEHVLYERTADADAAEAHEAQTTDNGEQTLPEPVALVLRDHVIVVRVNDVDAFVAHEATPPGGEPTVAVTSDVLAARLFSRADADALVARHAQPNRRRVTDEGAMRPLALAHLVMAAFDTRDLARGNATPTRDEPTVLDGLLVIGEARDPDAVSSSFPSIQERARYAVNAVLRAIHDPAGVYANAEAIREGMDEADREHLQTAEDRIVDQMRSAVRDMITWRRAVEHEAVGRLLAQVEGFDAETRAAIGKAILESPSIAMAAGTHVNRTMLTARAFAALFGELVKSRKDVAADVEKTSGAPHDEADMGRVYEHHEHVGYLRAVDDLAALVARFAAHIGIPLSADGSLKTVPGAEGVADVVPGSDQQRATIVVREGASERLDDAPAADPSEGAMTFTRNEASDDAPTA